MKKVYDGFTEKELDQAFLEQHCPKIVEGTKRIVAWLS